METIALINQKGGVAKTTTTVHLGIGLAKHGRAVLLLDIDPQGSMTSHLGYDPGALKTTTATLLQKVVDGAAKTDGPTAPAGVDAMGEPGGTVTPLSNAPTPATPAQAATPTTPPAQTPTVDAQRNYIRTEYMAELRKENVILPKTQVKEFTQGCSSNSEYVAAVVAALEKGREKTQEKAPEEKAVESKATMEKPVQPAQDNKPISPPVPSAASAPTAPKVGDAIKTGETPISGVVAKASEAIKATDVPKPPLAGTKPPEPPKPTEPPKVDKAVMAPAAPKAPEVPVRKVIVPTTSAALAPKPVEVPPAGKANTPFSSSAPAPKSVEPTQPLKPSLALPPKAEPTKQESGTEGLDNYLKNKQRPGKNAPQPGKMQNKPR